MNKVFNLSTPFFNSSSNAATPCNDDDIDKFAPVDFDVVDVDVLSSPFNRLMISILLLEPTLVLSTLCSALLESFEWTLLLLG